MERRALRLFGGSPTPTHGVDVTATRSGAGVASLGEHAVYLDNLAEGTVGKEPDPFLRGMAAGPAPTSASPYATTFELIPLG